MLPIFANPRSTTSSSNHPCGLQQASRYVGLQRLTQLTPNHAAVKLNKIGNVVWHVVSIKQDDIYDVVVVFMHVCHFILGGPFCVHACYPCCYDVTWLALLARLCSALKAGIFVARDSNPWRHFELLVILHSWIACCIIII